MVRTPVLLYFEKTMFPTKRCTQPPTAVVLASRHPKVSLGGYDLILSIICCMYRPSCAYNSPYFTTNSGAPVWNNNSSLTVGTRGPILLEDYHLVEKLANFDRERIPELVVHARGASAKGFFEVTHDISQLTCADFLRAPGVQTPSLLGFPLLYMSVAALKL
ncbi:hypothetical protein ACSBR2_002377 [Camellia fascicularis]